MPRARRPRCRGQVCSAGGLADCQRIAGGVWRRLAGVRCTLGEKRGSAVELEYHESCKPPPPTGEFERPLDLWAINLDCATASGLSFDGLLGGGDSGGPCPDDGVSDRTTCAPYAGYACRLRSFKYSGTGSAVEGRCRSLTERWRAFVFFKNFGI